MQSSIKTFFQRSGTLDASPPVQPSGHEAVETDERYRNLSISPEISVVGNQDSPIAICDTDIGTQAKPVSFQKKRRLTSSAIDNENFQQVQACVASVDRSNLSEEDVTNYIFNHEQAFRKVLHRRSVDELKKIFMETLISSNRPNQLWTKQFANRRCVNQDIDDLMCSWMRTFLRRRPIDINDDEVALLEAYRVRSAIEQQRDREFIVNDTDDDEIPLCRVLVLEGPVGSGKTSSVHSCLYGLNADKSGVIEVNASQRRRQSDLVNRFKEATQSQWISDRKTQQVTVKSDRHRKGKKGKRKSLPPSQVPDKHAVILIDDVDIAVEDDTGFSKGLAFLLKDTRRPIVLTCAQIPRNIQPLLQNGYYNFPLADQNQNSMISFLLSIALSQGAIALPSDDDLRKFIDLLRRDLRSAINNMQFWLDTDREKLIENVHANQELGCLTTSRISLYPLCAGFPGFRLDALWTRHHSQDRYLMIWHGLESGTCNVIHENYPKLSSEGDEDPKNIRLATGLANTAEGLSLADLFLSYPRSCEYIPLHSRMISLASGSASEYYEGLICQSYRNMEYSECILSSRHTSSIRNHIVTIWNEHYHSEPQPKHLPTCFSFAVDHMSAIRSISSRKTRNRVQATRRTRRYRHYLKNTLNTKGLESLERYCEIVNLEQSMEP